MATNVTANAKLAYLIPVYYEKRMLERLKPQLMFHQFGEKKALPKNEGQSVYWHRWNTTKMGRLIAESGAGASQGLSATRVSAALIMIGHHAVITTYIDMVSINSVVQGAIDLFADSAAVTLDFITSRMLLWKFTAVSATLQCSSAGGYVGDRTMGFSAGTWTKAVSCTSFQAPVWSINYLGSRLHAISGAGVAGGASATLWTPNVLRTIALKLKVKNAMRFEDGYYKLIMHPDMVNQLRGSSWLHRSPQVCGDGGCYLQDWYCP